MLRLNDVASQTRLVIESRREQACHPAAFSGTLLSIRAEIDDKLSYNSSWAWGNEDAY